MNTSRSRPTQMREAPAQQLRLTDPALGLALDDPGVVGLAGGVALGQPPLALPLADRLGGDFAGLRQRLDAGVLDRNTDEV